MRSGWFLPSLGELTLWWPINAIMRQQVDWGVIAQSGAEIGSFCGVMAIALLLDVSSLEVARQKTADLDQEFRSNGLANLLASVFGGFGGSLSMNACLLLDESGATTRWAGAIVGIVCAIILFSGVDVGSVVPKAILGGMLAYLGVMIIVELWEAPAQELMDGVGADRGDDARHHQFQLFHGRGARRHRRLPDVRAELQPHRRDPAPPHASGILQQCRALARADADCCARRASAFTCSGSRASSSSAPPTDCSSASSGPSRRSRTSRSAMCVLDFSAVPGLDTSAVLSLVKLRNYCEEHGVTLAFSGLSDVMQRRLQKAGFFGSERPHQVFGSRNEALEWCEDMLLMYHEVGEASMHSFESLARQRSSAGQLDMSRDRSLSWSARSCREGEFLFRQGEPSDSVVLQASGCVAITIIDEHGRPIRLRRMVGHTVVGEMGFYRARAAHGERDRRGADRGLPADARGLRHDAGR